MPIDFLRLGFGPSAGHRPECRGRPASLRSRAGRSRSSHDESPFRRHDGGPCAQAPRREGGPALTVFGNGKRAGAAPALRGRDSRDILSRDFNAAWRVDLEFPLHSVDGRAAFKAALFARGVRTCSLSASVGGGGMSTGGDSRAAPAIRSINLVGAGGKRRPPRNPVRTPANHRGAGGSPRRELPRLARFRPVPMAGWPGMSGGEEFACALPPVRYEAVKTPTERPNGRRP